MNIDAYEEMTWETPSDELEDAVHNLLAALIKEREENKQLRKELDQIKTSVRYLLRDSPSAFGAAIESHVVLHESPEYEDDESLAELKKLTEEEFYLFGAGHFDADGFWNDDETQYHHHEMLECFIKAQVRCLEAEGGVEKLRQRLRKYYGGEEE